MVDVTRQAIMRNTLMNSNSSELIDCHVIHVSAAGNSVRMEKMGLVTFLEIFRSLVAVTIKPLTADRHQQLRVYKKNERAFITHQFDIWHAISC